MTMTTTYSTRFRSTLAAWTALLGLVLAGASGASMAVLCVGVDGHLGVEQALESCCVATDPVPAAPTLGAVANHVSCASCSDIELTVDLLQAKRQSEGTVARVADQRSPTPAPPRHRAAASIHRQVLANGHLAQLATVVLLT